MLDGLRTLIRSPVALPSARRGLAAIADPEAGRAPAGSAEPQPISAFLCVIEYEGAQRMISCRRYDMIGEMGYVGAICHAASGYRQFRIDRIRSVGDPYSGEILGDGAYFSRFAVDSVRERAPTWNLSPSRRSTLVAGLNVMAFIARCDGQWHPLEIEPIERFVCSMWLRKEWDGDPPLDEIVAHAQRLAPDAESFFRSLAHYARSSSSQRILRQALVQLMEADGRLHIEEERWWREIDGFFRDFEESRFLAAVGEFVDEL